MTVHVDHLHVTDRKSITHGFVEHIEFKFADAKIQLLIQRQMLIVNGHGRLGIRRCERLPVGRRHGLLVAVMAAHKLNFVESRPLCAARDNEHQHKAGEVWILHAETFMDGRV